MSWWFWALTFLFIIVSVIMVLLILVQRPQGGGLAGAFGGAGAGGTETVFGGRTGDVLTLATVIVFSVYLLVAIGLNVMDKPLAEEPDTPPEVMAADDAGTPTGPGAVSTGTQPTSVPAPATTPGTSPGTTGAPSLTQPANLTPEEARQLLSRTPPPAPSQPAGEGATPPSANEPQEPPDDASGEAPGEAADDTADQPQ